MNTKRIIIAGGSGFLGQLLARHFAARGWEVVVLTRRLHEQGGAAREVVWDGRSPGDWTRELEGADAVINLAGRSVDCRYHARNRREIMQSRLEPTRALGEAMAQCAQPPRVWLNASTATIYRHTFGPAWDESGEIGAAPEAKDAFSIEVATAWEREFNAAPTPRTRKVALRSAMVLGHGRNSVFPVLRRMARLGLGGRMGSGRQFVSWVHHEDFCCAVEFVLDHDEITGVVNLAAPNPLPNAEMMRLFREVCGAPFGLPATEWMLELGAFLLRTETELIIKSRRVVPGRLLAAGFQFRFPELRGALVNLTASAS
jgi:uncharacterized protein (TIGR01777 family)